MIAQILMARPDGRNVRRAAVRAMAAVDLLLDEIGCDLIVELAVKPVDKSARFGAWQGLARKQLEAARLAVALRGLVEIFGDGVGASDIGRPPYSGAVTATATAFPAGSWLLRRAAVQSGPPSIGFSATVAA